MEAKISVIIPCYNQGHFLTESVESVVAQTYSNWECIIINDGSKDNTEDVALSFIKRDNRIKYIRKKNGGLSSARNAGLDGATGDFIQFLDCDDFIDKNKFAESLQEDAGADVIMTNFCTFSDNNQFTKPPFNLNEKLFNFRELLTGWDDDFVFPPHAGLFKSHFFDRLRFNEDLKAREDWHMWLQIYRTNPTTVFIDKPYASYRSSSNSMSQNIFLMNRSLLQTFELIYPILNEDEKDVFFEKVIRSSCRLLAETQQLLTLTRESNSFRLGNFFVRLVKPFSGIFDA